MVAALAKKSGMSVVDALVCSLRQSDRYFFLHADGVPLLGFLAWISFPWAKE
jgi:hypothetical protein